MADSYSFVKGGKLNLKGKKVKSKKHKKHKKRDREDEDEDISDDTLRHGGWRSIDEFSEITGAISIELGHMIYVQAQDNGLFSLGQSHEAGQGPDPEEIVMAVRLSDTKVALKSGFEKYLSVSSDGKVTGREDAIGGREQWEPIFQDGSLALQGSNQCFISATEEGGIVCRSNTAGKDEIIQIRTCAKKDKKMKHDIPKEEQGNLWRTEIDYVKKFQSYEDRHLKISKEDRSALNDAKEAGTLHGSLLDRREKMKADRYCK